VLNTVFPDRGTLIPSVIYGDVEVVEGVSSSEHSSSDISGSSEKGLTMDERVLVG
jgi:hypothetical protein